MLSGSWVIGVYSLAIPLTNLQPMIIMHWQPLHHNALSYVNRSSALSNQETVSLGVFPAPGRFPACRPSDDSPTKINRLSSRGACSSLCYADSPISRGRTQNTILRGGLIFSEIGISPTQHGQLFLTHRRAGLEGPHTGASGVTPMRCTPVHRRIRGFRASSLSKRSTLRTHRSCGSPRMLRDCQVGDPKASCWQSADQISLNHADCSEARARAVQSHA